MMLTVTQHRPARVRVVEPRSAGRHANVRWCALTWRAVQTLDEATLIEVQLDTGFLHQIRVMMAHLGHPVFGDRVYGKTQAAAPRHMLHAWSIGTESIAAVSPDPPDFYNMLAVLGMGSG